VKSKSRPKMRYRHMTPEVAAAIRAAYRPRVVTQQMLADRYGLRQHTVSRIISRQVWA
jgi:DNA invertase Pin-like site-specific DNA recombinase